MKEEKKFNRNIPKKKFRQLVKQKVHMNPERALAILKTLRNRAVVIDARSVRQKDGMRPVELSTMEYRALQDAIRMQKVRIALLHDK